jgi:peptide/nickel transport system permease protein
MPGRSFRKYVAKRLVNVALTILGIMILNFFLIHLMPGDPSLQMIPRDPKFDPSLKWQLVERFHLNDSIVEQLGWYMYNTVTLNWGTSYMTRRPVFDIIINDMRWTFLLVGISTVFTILIGMAIGAYSAYRRGGPFDISATSISLFFYGMPLFWLGIVVATSGWRVFRY